MKKFWIITIISLFTYIQVGYSGEKPLYYKIDIKKRSGVLRGGICNAGYKEAVDHDAQG